MEFGRLILGFPTTDCTILSNDSGDMHFLGGPVLNIPIGFCTCGGIA